MRAKHASALGRRLLVILGLSLFISTTTSDAQAIPAAGEIHVHALITGDGPWTSWLGGSAKRTVLLTIENRSSEALTTPELDLRFSSDRSDTALATPLLDDVAPGESIAIEIEIQTPRFTFGTHAVEGVLLGATEPLPIRAETTHIPWLLLLLPAIVLAQVALVTLRNRVRRHIYRPSPPASASDMDGPTSLPVLPSPRSDNTAINRDAEPIAAFIETELNRALDDLHRRRLDDDHLLRSVEDWARIVTRNVTDHFDLAPANQPRLAANVTRALLERAATPRRIPNSSA